MPPKQDESVVVVDEGAADANKNPKAYGCSHTSFYTDEEKKDSYQGLQQVLEEQCQDPKLRTCITDLMHVCADITEALRSTLVHVKGTANSSGDTQLSVDVSF